MVARYLPDDPLLTLQWHLYQIGMLGYGTSPDISGLERIWSEFNGTGIHVGIWDDGIQQSHWDLDSNYDPTLHVTVNGTINNGLPTASDSDHGTSVAGLIGAEANGQGGVGIAFLAALTSVRIFGGSDDINTNWNRYLLTLDSLSNFDITNHSYGALPDFGVYADVAKFAAASANGRGGLGTINFKAAGNDNIDSNGDSLDASRFTVSVAALGVDGFVKSYSSYGAHILVSAPAASVTTDRLGETEGYNGLLDGDYTDDFGGTSAATPVTAAVAALMLQANEGLGWRDVQNILAYSAIGTGSLYEGESSFENFVWRWNGASNWNGGGLHYSEDYGYGLVNAFNAVRMAEVWTQLHGQAEVSANEQMVTTGSLSVNKTIADRSTLVHTFEVTGSILIEHVDLSVTLTHSYFTDITITLISPDGTAMHLYDGSTGSGSTADSTFTYAFGAEGYRGELSDGIWTISIEDRVSGDSGQLRNINFTAYGTEASDNDVYHYTTEMLTALAADPDSGRDDLVDDEGIDWIDAATMVGDLVLDLAAGASSFMAGIAFLTIDALTEIENAVGGDGDDTLRGNSLDNRLLGMRGDDVLNGAAGTDTAVMSADWSAMRWGYDIVTSTLFIGNSAIGFDTVTGCEFVEDWNGVVRTIEELAAAPTAAVARLSAPVAHVSEGNTGTTTINITLSLNQAVTSTQSVAWEITPDGDNPADASDLAGTLSGVAQFEVGETSKTITLTVNGDTEFEGSETVSVNLSSATDGLVVGTSQFGIVIRDDDAEFIEIWGNDKPNKINGTDGNDRIYAGKKNDTLFGFGGNDELYAGSDNDKLYGGTGDDLYVTGTGLDRCYFDDASGTDRISDFDLRFDIIDLTETSILDFADLVASHVTTNASNHVVISTGTSQITIENLYLVDLQESNFAF